MANSYKGWEVTLKKDGSIVGKANSVSFEISTDTEAVYGVGRRDARIIKEGQKEISGSIEHMMVDDEFYLGLQGTYQPEYTLTCEVGTNTVTINGVKFETWSLDVPQDDYLVESIDFVATDTSWT